MKNRVERYIFSKFSVFSDQNYDHAIFIDECTVQANKNMRLQWFKPLPGETRIGLKGKYAHLFSLHVFAGISRRGPTQLVIFDGRFDSNSFKMICNRSLMPFICQNYPDHHRLQMYNSPVHVSSESFQYLLEKGINHFKTPAQSHDFNPIEMVWNDLKTYIAEYVKSNNGSELINGIRSFWETRVTIEYCNSKINHLYKVMRMCLTNHGKATGL